MTKQEILKDSTESIEITKYIDNIQQIPSAAVVSIISSTSAELAVPVTSAACTIDAAGKVSYALAAANTASLGENFRAAFTLTIGSRTYSDVIYFDIVLKRLESIITDQDLIDEYAVLDKLAYRVFGEVTSTSSSLTQIVDVERLNEKDDYFKGCEVEILSGANSGFKSTVSSFDGDARILYLATSLPAAVAVADKFLIARSFKTEIARAFEELKDYIRTQGYRPALVIDDTQIREVHIALSICKVLLPLGEAYRYEYQEFKAKYERLRDSLKLSYDIDESGNADSDEPDVHAGQIGLRR